MFTLQSSCADLTQYPTSTLVFVLTLNKLVSLRSLYIALSLPGKAQPYLCYASMFPWSLTTLILDVLRLFD